MDSFGICSVCSISRDQFIPLLCTHMICLQCCTTQNIEDNYLICPTCSQLTQLQSQTLDRIYQISINPQLNMSKSNVTNNINHKIQQLSSAYIHCIQGINKSFKHLHEQLNLKNQAIVNNITHLYNSEIEKMKTINITLKDSRGSTNSNTYSNNLNSYSKFMRMLRGKQYSLDINQLQKNIMELKLNFLSDSWNTKYSRSSHKQKLEQKLQEKQKKQKSINFLKDKSYNKIIGILNKSRSTLDHNIKTIKKSIMYRSPERINISSQNNKPEDSFD